MLDAKFVSTPLANHFKLSGSQCPKNEEEIENMSKVPYASAVGCLMYAMVCFRLDLAHAVSTVSRYMANPGIEYWNAIKWASILKENKGNNSSLASLYASQYPQG